MALLPSSKLSREDLMPFIGFLLFLVQSYGLKTTNYGLKKQQINLLFLCYDF